MTRGRLVRRRRLRAFGVPVVVLACLMGVLTFVAHTEWARDRLRDAAIDAIHTELGLRATLRYVDISLFPLPTVHARGIVLDDPVYGRFAEADGLIIRPSLWGLLRGEIDLQTIEIDGPTVNLVMREGEIRNLPRARGTPSTGGELPFSRLIARNARVSLDADPYGQAWLEGLDLDIEVESGDELNVRLAAIAGRLDHVQGSETLERLDIIAHIAPDGFEVEEFSLRTPHVAVAIEDAHIPVPFDESYSGFTRIHVDLARLVDLPHAWDLPPMSGVLEVEAHIEGGVEGPVGDGVVTLQRGVIDGRGLGDVQLELQVDRDEVRITSGSLNIVDGGGVAHVSGTLTLTERLPIDVQVRIHDLQFARLMQQLSVTPNPIVRWSMTGVSNLRGTLNPLRVDGPIRLQTSDFFVSRDAWHVRPQRRVMGVTRARFAGRVALRPDSLEFLDLVVDTPLSRINADVHLGFDGVLGVQARSDINVEDVSPLMDFPIGGHGRLTVDVSGTFDDPLVRGHLLLNGFAFNTFPMGDIESDYRLEKDGFAVRFPSVAAVKGESRYRVEDLFLDFTRERFETTARVHTEHFTLADFYHVFHFEDDERFLPYQGVVSGDTQIRYTLGFPNDSPVGTMTADMDLRLARADIQGFAFQGGAFEGRWRWLNYDRGYLGGELDVRHLHLRKGEGTINVTGRMGLNGALRMAFAADRVAIRDTEGLADRMPDLAGVFGVSGDISGTAEIPRANMDVVVTGLSYRDAMLGDGRAYIRLTDKTDPWIRAAADWNLDNLPGDEPCAAGRAGFHHGRWRADPPLSTVDGPQPRLVRPMAFVICGGGLGGQLAVDLAVGRTEVYPLRGRIDLLRFRLDPFLRQIQGEEPMIGHLTGRVALTGGAMLEPGTLEGSIRFPEVRVAQGPVELRNEGTAAVQLERDRFRIDRLVFAGPDSRVVIQGGGSTRTGLAVGIDGSLDLGMLAALSPRLTHAGGHVAVQASISGPMDSPAFFGNATVTGASFRYAGFPEPLTELGGRVTFSARRILFEDFSARMAGGHIALTGAATIRGRGLERYEFEVDARDLVLAPSDGVDVALGGRARLSWARQQRLPRLEGTLRLGRVVYERPFALGQSIEELSRQRRADVSRYDPDEDRVEFDLRIVDETPIRLANNLIEAQVEIEDSERPFRLVGTDQRFGAVGNLAISRGVLHFRDTDFEIRRGEIRFNDPERVDPAFDVTAETEIRRSGDFGGPNWRVRLQARGNRDAFQLNMSSEPELSEEDIVMLLTVGMTRAEAEQLQAGDLTGSLALEALATATGIGREVRRAMPIDDFQLRTQYSPRTDRTEPHLSIGKRITDRVRLGASTTLSESREFQTSLEWSLSENTSVRAVYDNINSDTASTLGNVGVDVRWRLEFE